MTPMTWKSTKIIPVSTTRNRCPKASAHRFQVKELSRERQSQALQGTVLLFTYRRDRVRSTPMVCVNRSLQVHVPPAPPCSHHRDVGLYACILYCSRRTLNCGAWNAESWRCVWGPLTHVLKQNKGAHVEYETEKAIPIQGKKLGMASVGPPALGKKVFEAQGPFLRGQEGGRKAARETHFPAAFPQVNNGKHGQLCSLHWSCYYFYLHPDFCKYTFRVLFCNYSALFCHSFPGHKPSLSLLWNI